VTTSANGVEFRRTKPDTQESVRNRKWAAFVQSGSSAPIWCCVPACKRRHGNRQHASGPKSISGNRDRVHASVFANRCSASTIRINLEFDYGLWRRAKNNAMIELATKASRRIERPRGASFALARPPAQYNQSPVPVSLGRICVLAVCCLIILIWPGDLAWFSSNWRADLARARREDAKRRAAASVRFDSGDEIDSKANKDQCRRSIEKPARPAG
jgi:hypothetical protein